MTDGREWSERHIIELIKKHSKGSYDNIHIGLMCLPKYPGSLIGARISCVLSFPVVNTTPPGPASSTITPSTMTMVLGNSSANDNVLKGTSFEAGVPLMAIGYPEFVGGQYADRQTVSNNGNTQTWDCTISVDTGDNKKTKTGVVSLRVWYPRSNANRAVEVPATAPESVPGKYWEASGSEPGRFMIPYLDNDGLKNLVEDFKTENGVYPRNVEISSNFS